MRFATALSLAVFAALSMCAAAQTYDGIRPSQEKEFIAKAEAGDVDAAYRLGFMYAFLTGHQNDAEAVRWLTKAAEKDHAGAECALGQLYNMGRGVERDRAKAAELYIRSADHGSAFGAALACNLLQFGNGIPKDPVRAFGYCKQSADQANVFGMFGLGDAYLRGVGTEINENEGMKWISRAAELGFGPAQERLARLKAPPAPQLGNVGAGSSFSSVVKVDPTPDPALQNLLKQAKEADDPSLAVMLYEKASETSASPLAWYELARLVEAGRGTPKNDARALELLIKSAKQEFSAALYRLGEKYRDGDGVQQDNVTAYKWFALAAKQGSQDGKAEQERVAQFLTPEQIANAQKDAESWLEQYPKIDPNFVIKHPAPVK